MTTRLPCQTALAMTRAAAPAVPGRPAPSVARDVVALATRAPSLHNTQPWHWRIVSEDVLELFAAHDRQLRVLDPRGRLMTLSLGAALHHAMVAARAVDRAVTVERFPVSGPPDLVARLHLGEVVHAGPAERIALSSLVARRTDRRPFSSWELPEERLRHLGELAASYGVTTVRLDARQRVAVERLAGGDDVPAGGGRRLLGAGRCRRGPADEGEGEGRGERGEDPGWAHAQPFAAPGGRSCGAGDVPARSVVSRDGRCPPATGDAAVRDGGARPRRRRRPGRTARPRARRG